VAYVYVTSTIVVLTAAFAEKKQEQQRAWHFYSPGVVRRSHAAADAAVYNHFFCKLKIMNN